MRILPARHGETPVERRGRYQGQIDIPLAEVRRRPGHRAGRTFGDVRIDRAIASPLSRAKTHRRVRAGDARRAQLMLDAGLMESPMASGKPARQRDPSARWRAPAGLARCPDTVQMLGAGGESPQQVLDRARPAFARACGLEDDTLLVVAHDAVNRVLLCRDARHPAGEAVDLPPGADHAQPAGRANVDALGVVRLNDCSHHTALFGEAVHRAL